MFHPPSFTCTPAACQSCKSEKCDLPSVKKLSPQQAVLSDGGLRSDLITLHTVSTTAQEPPRLLGEVWVCSAGGSERRLRIRVGMLGQWEGGGHVNACTSISRGSGVKVPSSPAAEHEWIWGNSHEYSIERYLSLSTFLFSPFFLRSQIFSPPL